MTRDEAIGLLVSRDLARLSSEERVSLLLDWWSIDDSDASYGCLPNPLKAAIARTDYPEDPSDSSYDPLVRLALRDLYVGVLSSYLTSQVAMLGSDEVVVGEEAMAACPCCRYLSLRKRGDYEICRVCFWEDDGTAELDRFSSPNHMTIQEARRNFERFGAVTPEAREHVIADGSARYARMKD